MTQTGVLGRRLPGPPFQAGAKTGSAQVTGEENANAVLVCFAPLRRPPDRPGHRGRAKGLRSALGDGGGTGAGPGDQNGSLTFSVLRVILCHSIMMVTLITIHIFR